MRNIINCTPHAVSLFNPETSEITHTFPTTQNICRVGQKNKIEGIFGVTEYTKIEGLPKPKENTTYIVSIIAFNACVAAGRHDVCFPSGKMLRSSAGHIQAVEFLCTSIK